MCELVVRNLGTTGEKLSVIGFGGIIVNDESRQTATDRVSEAVDLGVNYFDVAPSYGNAEDMLGPALSPYRNHCFLACKTTERTAQKAQQDLDTSLKKMETDHFDLYQLHAMTTDEEVEQVFGPDGAMHTLIRAQESGKVRYLGFSAHSEHAALKLMARYAFDTILFPVNFVCWFQGRFGPEVLAEAKNRNMGILALKSYAHTVVPEGHEKTYAKCWYIPEENEEIRNLAMRFTLSQGVTAAIPPGEWRFFRSAVSNAMSFRPLEPDEMNRLIKYSENLDPIFYSQSDKQ